MSTKHASKQACAGALAILGGLAVGQQAFAADVWNIDTAHSNAGFSVRHMMISNVKGDFSNVKGTVEYDGKNINTIKVNADIDVASVNTNDKGRDEHLRKADFFDTEKFPKMTFKSKKVKSLGKGKFALVGDLTMKGVTKEVTLDVEGPSAVIKDGRGGTKVGASASTKINRKDFGLSYGGLMDNGGAMIGDEVKITLEIEADKAKEAAKAPEKEAAKAPEKGAAK